MSDIRQDVPPSSEATDLPIPAQQPEQEATTPEASAVRTSASEAVGQAPEKVNPPEATTTLAETESAKEPTPPSQSGNVGYDVPVVQQVVASVVSAPVPPTALPSNQLSTEAAIERIDGMLRRLALEHDKESWFQQRVTTSVQGCENYYDKIKRPMWFARVREKLRGREYRTLLQIQADVELICHNAMTFNHKISKVYKNAQGLLKGARKQFAVERPLLHEAMLALHPEGPEAALKDEAEAKKAMKMAPPPKKPPAKPSKPAIKPSKPAKPSRLASVVSLGSLQANPVLEFISPTDLQLDLHDDSELGYSSFSDSEDECIAAHSAEQSTKLSSITPWDTEDVIRPTKRSKVPQRPDEWRERSSKFEYRLKWLELRLKELNHQHKRYSDKLEKLDPIGDLKADNAEPMDTDPASAEAVDNELQTQNGEGTGMHSRKARQTAVGLKYPDLITENPVMAARVGLRPTKQKVRSIAEADLSEDDINFPARIFAGAEILEQHLHGLRQQLCQPGFGLPFKRNPGVAQPSGKAKALKARPQGDKPLRAAKRRQSDLNSSFVISGLNASQAVSIPEKVKTIETPAFIELTENDWNERKAMLDEHDSSEDTSDEKYTRLHSVEEEKERAPGGDQKKKKKLKTTQRTVLEEGRTPSLQPSTTLTLKSELLKGLPQGKKEVTIGLKTAVTPQATGLTVKTPAAIITEVTTTSGQDARATLTPRSASRGRGRGRGRPPGGSKLSMSAPPSKRMAGPGRGHKREQSTVLATPAAATPQAEPLAGGNQTPQTAPPAIQTAPPSALEPSKVPENQGQTPQTASGEKQSPKRKEKSPKKATEKAKSPKTAPDKA